MRSTHPYPVPVHPISSDSGTKKDRTHIRYRYHQMILNNELPYTRGGGIGQSRLCMLLMGKAHIGEVQSSLWDEYTLKLAKENGIIIL